MKKIIALLSVAALVVAGYFFYKHSTAKRLEVNPKLALNAGGNLVRAMFHAWSLGEREKMFEMYRNPSPEAKDKFVRALKHTPIHWQMLEFVSEEKTANGWKVVTKLEITDPSSAFAAYAFHMKLPGNPMGSDTETRLSPDVMGIEELISIRQTWVVEEKDGKLLIDLGAKKTSGDTYEKNIMNFVVHSSLVNDLPQKANAPLSIEDQKNMAAVWMSDASKDLGLSLDEMANLMIKSAPMVHKAAATYNAIAKELRAKGQY